MYVLFLGQLVQWGQAVDKLRVQFLCEDPMPSRTVNFQGLFNGNHEKEINIDTLFEIQPVQLWFFFLKSAGKFNDTRFLIFCLTLTLLWHVSSHGVSISVCRAWVPLYIITFLKFLNKLSSRRVNGWNHCLPCTYPWPICVEGVGNCSFLSACISLLEQCQGFQRDISQSRPSRVQITVQTWLEKMLSTLLWKILKWYEN